MSRPHPCRYLSPLREAVRYPFKCLYYSTTERVRFLNIDEDLRCYGSRPCYTPPDAGVVDPLLRDELPKALDYVDWHLGPKEMEELQCGS